MNYSKPKGSLILYTSTNTFGASLITSRLHDSKVISTVKIKLVIKYLFTFNLEIPTKIEVKFVKKKHLLP